MAVVPADEGVAFEGVRAASASAASNMAGRSVQAETQRSQAPDRDVAGLGLGHAHGQVGIAPVQVQRLHAADQLHAQPRMAREQLRQRGHDQRVGQVLRRGQPHHARDLRLAVRGIAQGLGRLLQRLGRGQQRLAVGREPIAALVAAEQRHGQRGLQPVQPARDRGHAQPQRGRGAAQAAGAGNGQEDAGVVPLQWNAPLFSGMFFGNFFGNAFRKWKIKARFCQ